MKMKENKRTSCHNPMTTFKNNKSKEPGLFLKIYHRDELCLFYISQCPHISIGNLHFIQNKVTSY